MIQCNMEHDMDHLITPGELMTILRLPSLKSLYCFLSANPDAVPPPIRIGRLLRWKSSAVQAWIESQ